MSLHFDEFLRIQERMLVRLMLRRSQRKPCLDAISHEEVSICLEDDLVTSAKPAVARYVSAMNRIQIRSVPVCENLFVPVRIVSAERSRDAAHDHTHASSLR